MKTSVHLVSMPWNRPVIPSIQTACLSAHLRSSLGALGDCGREEPRVEEYSLFLDIIGGTLKGSSPGPFNPEGLHDAVDRIGASEAFYFLLYLWKFGFPGLERPNRGSLEKSVEVIAKARLAPFPGRKLLPLDLHFFETLMHETERAIDLRLSPRLESEGLHLVGFTLNFHQVYASLYCARHLIQKRKVDPSRVIFLFGGMSAARPEILNLLRGCEIPAYLCLGEGEKRLELIVRNALAVPASEAERMISDPRRLTQGISGVYSVCEEVDLHEIGRNIYEDQIRELDRLPIPEYREYYESLKRLAHRPSQLRKLSSWVTIPVEGTRGCFAKCDFCGNNHLWEGFRKMSAPSVLKRAESAMRKYRPLRIEFVDNVCDTWAEKYSDRLIERGIGIPAFMEMRAHHPETFWSKLFLAGTVSVQIGVEALSQPLLSRIGKGTRVIQNLTSYKYVNELGMRAVANLITHHPASTLEDILETRRVLEQLGHLEPFGLSAFQLSIGSPWYFRLTKEERRRLKPRTGFPAGDPVLDHLIEFGYELPERMQLAPEVNAAWDDFSKWYLSYTRLNLRKAASMKVLARACAGRTCLEITDRRRGRTKIIKLEGISALIFDRCHHPNTTELLAKFVGVPEDEVLRAANELVAEGLLLRTGENYFSPAMRPRADLVANLQQARGRPIFSVAEPELAGLHP